MRAWFLALGAAFGLVAALPADTIIATNSAWRCFKGLSEASNPTNAWRDLGFDDSSWLTGSAPFHYGTNAAGGDEDLSGGTLLADMPGRYTGLFLRREFVLSTNALTELRIGFYTDDGLIAWVNGVEVRVAGVSRTRLAYTNLALTPREAVFVENTIPFAMLRNGTNVLAVQALNALLDDDDFRVDVQLTGTFADITPPVLAAVAPPAESTLTHLTAITVTFSEPVQGVTPDDLRLNGVPSLGVSGAGQTYTFSVPQPGAGTVEVDWDAGHGITDASGNRFDASAPGALWSYSVVDGIPPVIASVSPERDGVVTALCEIRVEFSEPVQGVDQGDLRVNGAPATGMTPVNSRTYVFAFPPAPPGEAVVAWDPGHAITDEAAAPNAFVAEGWSYVVLPPGLPNRFVPLTNHSTWRYVKGTAEASDPTNAWRELAFDDRAWPTNAAPFHFGTNSVGGDDELTGGTVLGDMGNGYTCVFLRQAFVLATNNLLSLTLSAHFDDGFAAWINGQSVAFPRVSLSRLAYTNTATFPLPEAAIATFNVPLDLLRSGTNLLAVQAFNCRISDPDFRFDAELIAESVDAGGPVIVGAIPPRESTLSQLSAVTLVFDEPVAGLDASDLRINGAPPLAVIGQCPTNRFTFHFTQPTPGRVAIDWDDTHEITDLAGNRFDPLAPGARWGYTLADLETPTVVATVPAAGAEVTRLTGAEVVFSEPVRGVDAADLLVNGVPASSLSGDANGPYRFLFDTPAAGPVRLSWADSHGITDRADPPNAFDGQSWTVVHDPAAVQDVVINEFLASNVATNSPLDLDEDGELQDWIELWNRGIQPVNLLGWSLTDDPAQPGLWTFPAIVLEPGEFLLVYASGKDRRPAAPGAALHTNFRLNLGGEYLALFPADSPGTARTVFDPAFPEQRTDFSHGRDTSGQWRYYAAPTPGAANGVSSTSGVAPPPHVSVPRGMFAEPFTLLVSSTLPDATLRYTTDGSEPTAGTGMLYSGPLRISQTTPFRVAAFGSGLLPSLTETHTYLFPAQVLRQPTNPPGFPPTWGTWSSGGFPNNQVPADYEMDPEIVDHPAYREAMREALMALPVLSVVLPTDDLFGATRGIYSHVSSSQTQYRGPAWERGCSAEFILTNGETGFQIDCGIQMQGNASRDPHKQPKHSMRLLFKGAFGPGKLDYELFPGSPVRRFDTIVLRADFNDAWTHWDPNQRLRGQRIRDAWTKDTMRAMGGLAGHNRFLHLYLNGLYWGVYDASERIDADFGATRLGGEERDYDAVVSKPTEAINGDLVAYNQMIALTGLDSPANYNAMLQYLDLTQFVDYTLLHFYGANRDWGVDGNWNAIRRRSPEGRFLYVPWDCERLLEGLNDNRVSSTDVPSGLHTKLIANAEYRLAFADRVHRHLFNDGALTPEAVGQRYRRRVDEVELPLLAESARWGDYRRDVHSYQTAPYYLYTRDAHWQTEKDRLLTQYFPQRTGVVLQQLRTANLYPGVAAPVFNQHGGRIPGEFLLTMTAPAGVVYFTLHGSDPRTPGSDAVAPTATAYSAPVALTRTTQVQARTLHNGAWSALNAATFVVEDLLPPVRIVELMYNPLPGGSAGEPFEFIEIQNTGSIPVDLSGCTLDGVACAFAAGTILQPGARLVLASAANPAAWLTRYPGVTPHGWFQNRLSNGGESIALLDPHGTRIVSVDYAIDPPWPAAANAGGASLEIIDPNGDPDDPANWRASPTANGTPGLPPAAASAPDILLNELMADNETALTNGGTTPDWIELHNRGAQPVDLAGWSLTDHANPPPFVFPNNTRLEPGGFLVVWCDTDTNAPGLHAGFALNRQGETVGLYDATSTRVDAVSFGPQIPDASLGRIAGSWMLTVPTPCAANLPASLAPAADLRLNEWVADAPPGGADWVELFNPSATAPAALQGIFLATSNAMFQLKSLSFVAPGGFVQLFADELPGPDHLDFKLPKEGGQIVLYDATAAEVHRVAYGPQRQGVSEGLLPNGSASIVAFAASVSPAASNYLAVYTGPRLNEILAWNRFADISPWGQGADWIELANTNAQPADLSGMALSDSPTPSSSWMFPLGTGIPPGGFLRVWCDASVPASTTAADALNTGFALNRESGGVYLFNPQGQLVDQVEHGFQVGDLSIGWDGSAWSLLATPTPGATNAPPAALGDPTRLRLNEWMANPAEGDDWFEVYNPETAPVAMAGMHLTDNPSVFGVTRYSVAPLSFIGAKSWVLWQADNNPSLGRNHVNFALDALGETLRLYTAAGTLVDAVDYGLQSPGTAVGRLPDGGDALVPFPASASPEHANFLPLTQVVINEVLTRAADPLEDALELHNPGPSPIDIGGWYLSDTEIEFKRYRVPTGTTLAPGGFIVFYACQFESQPPPLNLNGARGGQVFLSATDANGNLTGCRTTVAFGPAEDGVSFGRHPTSIGTDFVALSQPTFGVQTPSSLAEFRSGTGAPNAPPRVGPVVISEIMFHPVTNVESILTELPDEEFVEVHNVSGTTVEFCDPSSPTNRWRLNDAVSLAFPPGSRLAPGESAVAVRFDPLADPAALTAFRSRYGVGPSVQIFGPWSGRLSNEGEPIELLKPAPPETAPPDAGLVPYVLVERIAYQPGAPWPAEAGGTGRSLQRLHPDHYGNEPANWHAAPPTPGLSPNLDSDGDGMPDTFEEAHGLNRLADDAQDDLDGDGLSNLDEYRAGTLPDDAQSSLRAEIAFDGTAMLSFTAAANRAYEVQYCDSLEQAEWHVLASLPASSSSIRHQISDAAPASPRFYRLKLVPAP
ncbi:MAG: lamin tail domain-containing protein [Verrucomicrobia bacterium]|nr:lamin tail domain-containing protein [Verrucomicrobiota bacterium]